jgi:hypothetical protein
MMVVKKEDTTTAVETLQLRYASAVEKPTRRVQLLPLYHGAAATAWPGAWGCCPLPGLFLPAIAQPFFY